MHLQQTYNTKYLSAVMFSLPPEHFRIRNMKFRARKEDHRMKENRSIYRSSDLRSSEK